MSQPPVHSVIEQLHREAIALLNRGALSAADARCCDLLALVPNHADAVFLRGVVAAARGSLTQAVTFLQAALAIDAERAEYHAQLARCLVLSQDTRGALAAAEQALARRPTDALTFDTVGNVLVRLHRHTEAMQAFRQAVALAPHNAGYQFNLATACKFTGETAAAEQAYEACIAVAPTFWPAHSGLAQLRRQSPAHNHLARLRKLEGAARGNADAELHLHHALAKEYEDLGEYARAFEHLVKGKTAKRARRPYDRSRDEALFATLERLFPTPRVDVPGQTDTSARPIFVVGMPRTGTTLVDRILSSHSQVESLGELPYFAAALRQSLHLPAASALDAAALARSNDIDFAALGHTYLTSVLPLLAGRAHFIDKMPHNFLYAPHLQLALPSARIICLRRNPLDTCLSNFRQLFALDNPQYDYAYDLLDIGNYFVRFDRLIARWRALLGERLLEVSYEDLVASQETVTRRMLEFCGLAWEPACLHFEHNPTAVATASAMQVRTGLHERALNRWRHYAAELQPLYELLTQHDVLSEKHSPQ